MRVRRGEEKNGKKRIKGEGKGEERKGEKWRREGDTIKGDISRYFVYFVIFYYEISQI